MSSSTLPSSGPIARYRFWSRSIVSRRCASRNSQHSVTSRRDSPSGGSLTTLLDATSSTLRAIICAFFCTWLTSDENSVIAASHVSTNSRIPRLIQLSGEYPGRSAPRSSLIFSQKSSRSTASRRSRAPLYLPSMSESASRHAVSLSSWSATLSAVSGMANPMRSKYRHSRRSATSAGWKFTTIFSSGSAFSPGAFSPAPEGISDAASSSPSSSSSFAVLRMLRFRWTTATASALWTHSPYSRFSYFITALARSVYLRAHTAAAGSSRIASSASVCSSVIVLRTREKTLRDQAIAPATGGWFLFTGGWWCRASNSSRASTISRVNCSRMSLNLSAIVFPMAPSDSIAANDLSRANASSALRSFLNEASMNTFAARSIVSFSAVKFPSTMLHAANDRLSKTSKSTPCTASVIAVTRAMTASISSGSPVTALSCGPKNLWKLSTVASMFLRSAQIPAW